MSIVLSLLTSYIHITLSLIKNYYFFMELTTVLSYQLQEEVFLIKDKLCEDTVHGHYY